MIDPNGTLSHEDPHGYVWTTRCRKCGTMQRIRMGDLHLANIQSAIAEIDSTPMECPGGYHVELSGWKQRWSLDLALTRLGTLQATLNAAHSRAA